MQLFGNGSGGAAAGPSEDFSVSKLAAGVSSWWAALDPTQALQDATAAAGTVASPVSCSAFQLVPCGNQPLCTDRNLQQDRDVFMCRAASLPVFYCSGSQLVVAEGTFSSVTQSYRSFTALVSLLQGRPGVVGGLGRCWCRSMNAESLLF